MELSLPAWLGALCGMIVAVAIYVPAIRLVERHLRKSSDAATPEQRAGFEDKLSVVRHLILACALAILASLGYWLGNILGGLGGVRG
jgi:protein-S-isoprenylcysteine O-methyltransferase Ste14